MAKRVGVGDSVFSVSIRITKRMKKKRFQESNQTEPAFKIPGTLDLLVSDIMPQVPMPVQMAA
jgi:hypothetical protein